NWSAQAGQSLLREEAWANIALENLPTVLLQLFKQAYASNHVKVLRKIVEYKLEVLTLRSVGQNYLDVWPGSMDDWLPQTSRETQAVAGCSKAGVKQPLKVAVDLVFRDGSISQLFSFLLQWAKRKGSLELYCGSGVLQTLGLHNAFYNATFLLDLAPYLGRMRDLRKLSLTSIHEDNIISPEEKHIITEFTSKWSSSWSASRSCIWKLSPSLRGHLHQLLRSMKTPLDDLEVTHLKAGPTLVSLDLEDCHTEDCHLYAILPALSSCLQLTKFSF
ncbi:hypothetical protein A6R68_04754, partial [Neotoma lepida]